MNYDGRTEREKEPRCLMTAESPKHLHLLLLDFFGAGRQGQYTSLLLKPLLFWISLISSSNGAGDRPLER